MILLFPLASDGEVSMSCRAFGGAGMLDYKFFGSRSESVILEKHIIHKSICIVLL